VVSRPELARRLTTSHAAAVVVGTVIGSGIFLVPTEMMQAVGSAKLVFTAWIIGGLLSLCGALTYAELGAMKPQAGGEYIYIRDAYGPLGGFLYGWTYFTIAQPGTLATVATGIVRILGTFAPLAFLGDPVTHRPLVVTYGQLLAIAAILLVASINWIGVERAGAFQLFFTVLKIVIIVAIVVAGFSYRSGGWHNFSTSSPNPTGGLAGFMAALLAALWAYDGWNLVTTVSGEIRDPRRSLPIALAFGVATVAVLYIAVNAALQFVMPASGIAGSPQPASAAMALVLGRWGAGIVSIGMVVSMLVCLNGNTMTGARIPFAMSRDRCFFQVLAQVHRVFGRHRPPSRCRPRSPLRFCSWPRASASCSRSPCLPSTSSRLRRRHPYLYFAVKSPTLRARTVRGDTRWFLCCSSPHRYCCCITHSARMWSTRCWRLP
jgi:APA family basic amino acid/polyamine antiporter